MSLKSRSALIALLAAIAIPASAVASHGPGTHGHGSHTVMYVFKGTYAGSGAVNVTHGNGHVKHASLVDTTVQFDLTNAKLTVADTNADGTVDANDIVTDDKVLVQARLAKPDPGAQPFAAKHLVDQTNPPPDSGGSD